ncbi:MAG: hypothetical protein C0594_01490, partial [Marinilabiliales bacterium]
MHKVKIFISIFFCFVFTLSLSLNAKSEDKQVLAQKGCLDLTQYDFDKELVNLDGEWEFYWNQLLYPQDFTYPRDSIDYIVVPSIWTKGSQKHKSLSGEGYATYRLQVKVLDNGYNYGIKLRYLETAYKLWINGKLIMQNGKVAKKKKNAEPEFLSLTKAINIKELCKDYRKGGTCTLDIVVQVSNFHHIKAGILEPLKFGSFDNISAYKDRRLAEIYLITGIILIMAIYHFLLFFLRRKEISNLYFGIFSLLMVLRITTTDERIIKFWLPDISWELLSKLEYISAYVSVAFIIVFFLSLFRKEFNKIFLIAFMSVGLLMVTSVVCFPLIVYTKLKLIYIAYMIIGGSYLIFYVLPKAIINKRTGAFLALLGMLVLYGTGINDILRSMGVIHTLYIAPYGLVIYIFSQSYLISKRFSIAFNKVEEISADLQVTNKKLSEYQNHLEKLVDERTSEVVQQKEEIQAQADQLFAVNQELEKLSLVASETDNAILITDEKGNLEWINDSFTRLYGYKLSEYKKIFGETLFEVSNSDEIKKNIKFCINNCSSIS